MKRRVLAVPLDEIEKHLSMNTRQDVKVVVPEILTRELFEKLTAEGKKLKPEVPFDGHAWARSPETEPNRTCESRDFWDDSLAQPSAGPFTISFANEKAEQEVHLHRQHVEIYFSEYPFEAEFRFLGEEQRQDAIILFKGGLLVFSPNVIHRVKLGGVTVIIELPSVPDDRVTERL